MTWEIKNSHFLKITTDNNHDVIVAVDKIAFAVDDSERGSRIVRITFIDGQMLTAYGITVDDILKAISGN